MIADSSHGPPIEKILNDVNPARLIAPTTFP
jgi:hypothetical protein